MTAAMTVPWESGGRRRRRSHLVDLVANISYEVMPFKNTEREVLESVPTSVALTVTVTEAKGIYTTPCRRTCRRASSSTSSTSPTWWPGCVSWGLFALVAQRALAPGSKLAATRWVAERAAITDCPGFSDDSAYAAMDFLLAALPEIAARIFDSVAHLLNLEVDIVFVDTTSTYWEVDGADELADLDPEPEPDDGTATAVEGAARRFGTSTDHRDDLPQVVIAMAVTRDGIPVRCWTFPGDTGDQKIIRTVTDDLGSWNLRRPVWCGRRRVRLGGQPRVPDPRRRALPPR